MAQTKQKIDWDVIKPIQGFDCVKAKRAIQARIYEETKNMTPEEKREYIRKKCEKFEQEWVLYREKNGLDDMEGGDTYCT
ncbi:hypothetical protein FACS189419_04980 [Planctomycetales bacterium]|nr:hypothetical protein FACS189419_04980 [Planctomycetales bacterium]